MAQTTAAIGGACGEILIGSTNVVAAATDISGQAQSLATPSQSRQSGEAYTLLGDTAIIKGGKREPIDLTFTIVYTEEDTEAWELARAEFEAASCGDPLYVWWSPGGGDIGDQQYSGGGTMTGFDYPPVDATAPAPIMCTFTIRVASLSTVTITS